MMTAHLAGKLNFQKRLDFSNANVGVEFVARFSSDSFSNKWRDDDDGYWFNVISLGIIQSEAGFSEKVMFWEVSIAARVNGWKL